MRPSQGLDTGPIPVTRSRKLSASMRVSTLCYLVNENKVLLAIKKRGFGAGKYNGVGGKVETGESYEQSAVREVREEIGVVVNVGDLECMGNLTFHSENPDLNWKSRIFFIKKWQGDPVETEEMKPEWFLFSDAPYKKMWVDDAHWFPLILSGQKIDGEFYFNNDGSKIEKFFIKQT
jgi:ADP-ribose pyrophosphatase YjhB (NUDIX family)